MSDVELAAEKWHDDQADKPSHEDEFSGCWCCCTACDLYNPYYDDAQAAMSEALRRRDAPDPPGESPR